MTSPIPDLIPARMLNEHVYCRRLAYLEWVDQQFVDNADTAEGTFVHRVVDRERSSPPDPVAQTGEPPPSSSAVTVSSERLGLIAKVDLLEASAGVVVPIEYKRGRPREPDSPLWEPELVQLCAQVLALRDTGYDVPHAEVYFDETRTRHHIEITPELIERTTAAIEQLRDDAARDVTVGSALLRACFDNGTPVLWFTAGGWFSGFATGMPPKNVAVRMRQHRAAALGNPELAAAFVVGKIRNCRTLLRRHSKENTKRVLDQLADLAKAAENERNLESLLGIEGTAARLYFSRFGSLLKTLDVCNEFAFEERNRRPPRDPVNALLSFVYALLVKDVTAAVMAAGLDPYIGVYHRPGFGRPALALDMAEEFRPLVGDSTVMTVINNGEIVTGDFIKRAGGVALTDRGRRKLIAAYEQRMTTELRHPLFRYRASYRRCLEIQARLLAAVLIGDAPAYRPLTTR